MTQYQAVIAPQLASSVVPGQRTSTENADESLRLVERFQAGDRDAYADIYRRYEDPIVRFLYSRVRDRDLARDLAQDTFAKALPRLDRWQWQGSDLGAWLITIARNLVSDHFKGAHQKRTTCVGDDLATYSEGPDHRREANPESAVIEHERDIDILTALNYLTADQRMVLIHRFLEELSVAETAAVMGREEGAIKALQYRAVRMLAREKSVEGWR